MPSYFLGDTLQTYSRTGKNSYTHLSVHWACGPACCVYSSMTPPCTTRRAVESSGCGAVRCRALHDARAWEHALTPKFNAPQSAVPRVATNTTPTLSTATSSETCIAAARLSSSRAYAQTEGLAGPALGVAGTAGVADNRASERRTLVWSRRRSRTVRSGGSNLMRLSDAESALRRVAE